MAIKHPTLAEAATSCEQFNDAVQEVDQGRRTTFENRHLIDGPNGPSGLWPIDNIESIDVDPVELADYREELEETTIPRLEQAIENAEEAIAHLEDEEGEAAEKQLLEAQEELGGLKTEFTETAIMIDAIEWVEGALDSAAERAASAFVGIAEEQAAATETVLTMTETAEEYEPAATDVRDAAKQFDKATNDARFDFSDINREYQERLKARPYNEI